MDKAQAWLLASLRVFQHLARAFPHAEAGVAIRNVVDLHPGGMSAADRATRAGHMAVWPEELAPARLEADTFSYQAPVVHMRTYLPFVRRCCLARGVRFHRARVASLAHAVEVATRASPAARGRWGGGGGGVVVNCTGLGSRSLEDVRDGHLYPNRGVLVLVDLPSATSVVTNTAFDGEKLAYVCPQKDGVLACGGLSQKGAYSTTVTDEEARGVLERCASFTPGLRAAKVLGTWAGLRPSRHGGVRLEPGAAGPAPGAPLNVIHNYGHGGSGVVLSWCVLARALPAAPWQPRAPGQHANVPPASPFLLAQPRVPAARVS